MADDFDVFTYGHSPVMLGFHFYDKAYTLIMVMDPTCYRISLLNLPPAELKRHVLNPATLMNPRLGVGPEGTFVSTGAVYTLEALQRMFPAGYGGDFTEPRMLYPRGTVTMKSPLGLVFELLKPNQVRMLTPQELDPAYGATYKMNQNAIMTSNPQPIKLGPPLHQHTFVVNPDSGRLLTSANLLISNIKALDPGIFADPFMWQPKEDNAPVIVQIVQGKAMRMDEME